VRALHQVRFRIGTGDEREQLLIPEAELRFVRVRYT
jgi:hypothetical protein